METKELTEKIQGIGEAFHDFKKANDERLALIEKGAAVPAELTEKVEGLTKTIGDLEAAKTEMEKQLARKAKSSYSADSEKAEQAATDFYKMACGRRGIAPERDGFSLDGMKAYSKAFEQMMRKGDMSPEVAKALSVGSDPDGGYMVTPGTNGRIVSKVFETSPLRQFASVQAIGTDALEGTLDLDEASSGWVSETETRAETGTPQIQKWRIPTHELYAKPRATQKMIDDSMIDIEAWLSNKVSEKFARDEATAFVNGDGISRPRGFLTYPSGTTLIPRSIQRHNTGVNGGFLTTGAGGDVVLDAIYSLKMAYRNGARFAMNRTTIGTVRKVKDGDGNYIWQPGLAAGEPSTLAGYQIAEFEDMPDPATDSLSIAFANWSEAYQIVDRIGIRVLRDPYSAKPYVEYYTTKRVGGDVLNFEAIKLIEFTA